MTQLLLIVKARTRIVRWALLLATLAILAVHGAAPSSAAEPSVNVQNIRLLSLVSADPESAVNLHVRVDPRVELVALVFHLAGNPEYSQGRLASYTEDADRKFDKFRDLPAVKLARELRSSRGVGYDACMNLAVLLTWGSELALKIPLEPRPDFLDRRWTAKSASNFVVAARQFSKDTRFKDFIVAHQDLYRASESRMRNLMNQEGHLGWFSSFFGERSRTNFTIILEPLGSGWACGLHCRDGRGKEELFCILGVWATDKHGVPVFGKEVMGTVVHEFCHSYANPIIFRHESELRAAGEKLFQPAAEQMDSQLYGNAQALLCESLVRASVVRYLHRYSGPDAADGEIRAQKAQGFSWMQELSDLLGQYEAERERYPTLESFSPQVVTFFNDYASRSAIDQPALDPKRPKVVSLVPANGAANVYAGLKAIEVVFDRPMRDRSWSMCNGGAHYPEAAGQPRYDIHRMKWTIPVKLEPGWDYEFWLNTGQYQGFQSEDGVPLKPVRVRFRTGS